MQISRIQWKRTVAILIVVIFALPLVPTNAPLPRHTTVSHSDIGQVGYSTLPFQAIGSPSYDEQVGITFTQNFSRLGFNVTAVAQTEGGFGPAYLLNGLTDQGYWYQVGLSYAWPRGDGTPSPGFNMSFEVFDPSAVSVFPQNGGGGLDNLRVNPGDLVLLSLYFSNRNVTMEARDWNTHSVSQEAYPAFLATSFIGLTNEVANPHFFTGLMTEQYHNSPFYGAGSPTFYTSSQSFGASVWMWVDEMYIGQVSGYDIFRDATPSPVQLQNTAGYFSSNGTAEVANHHSLVTGLTPVTFPTVAAGAATGYANHQAEAAVTIKGEAGTTILFANMTIQAIFSNYNVSSSTPITLNSSTGTYNATLTLPTALPVGNYKLTVRVSSWQYLEPQANEWIQLPPTQFNETLRVTNAPQPKPPPSSPNTPGPGMPGPSPNAQAAPSLLSRLWTARTLLVPSVVVYIALVSAIVLVAVRRDNFRRFGTPIYRSTSCPRCGQQAPPWSSACPTCGESLVALQPREPIVN